ncbi:hypothetical protein, partial [Escherichia coli]|uniref:hypothetical protein n=1 Tax=Escherichia coli TaxID=562 RepID=UPI001BC89CBB
RVFFSTVVPSSDNYKTFHLGRRGKRVKKDGLGNWRCGKSDFLRAFKKKNSTASLNNKYNG